jgi:gag-polypeptide of LTR copia-type
VDTISKVKIQQQLNRITMKNESDPALLFEQLSSIEEKFMAPGDKIDEADLIAIVLDFTPDAYQLVLTAVQSANELSLTLSDLAVVMQQPYRQLSRSKNHKNNKDMGEELLGAFHGKCFYCSKSGH